MRRRVHPAARAAGTKRRAVAAATTALALVLAACVGDTGDSTPVGPETPEPGGELFLRYVALGNSITAGVQSLGINDSTQNLAYPVLLADKAGATFGVPSLAAPGCPPPLAAPWAEERIGGGTGLTCSGRVGARPERVSNLAVPGARLADATRPADGSGSLAEAILIGGRSQAEAMAEADPTLVTVWLGNNDALSAATRGDTLRLTSPDAFRRHLDSLVAAIERTGAREVVLIGVVDPTRAPVLQPGAYFWLAERAGALPREAPVADGCAPVDGEGRPNEVAFRNRVSFYILVADPPIEIRCTDDAPFVLTEGERDMLAATIADFNAAIREAAETRGWIYLDADAIFTRLAEDPERVRRCQDLHPGIEPDDALARTCPGPGAPNGFGSLLSFDGFHPSTEAHALFADSLAAVLNRVHGLSLPVP